MSEVTAATGTAPAVAEDPNALVKMEAIKFHFKKDKTLGEKRPTIELTLPMVTFPGMLAALEDEKQRAFILDIINEEIYKAARLQVGDEGKPVNKTDELDMSKLSLEALANMPKAERTGGGISKEIWEDFGKDYLEVMPGVNGKTLEQVGNAVKILAAKFQPIKTNKRVIQHVLDQLNLYITKTPNLEDFQECVQFLQQKADTLLKADEAKLLENL